MVLTYGLAIDIQFEQMTTAAAARRPLGAAIVKVVPFAVAGMLLLRYGINSVINWPFLVFVAIAGLSLVILPIGRVAGFGDMARSFIGSTAPFVLAFALAPHRFWTALCRGVALVPLVSVLVGLVAEVVGFSPILDPAGRLQRPALGAVPGRLLRHRRLRLHAGIPPRLPAPLAAARRVEPRHHAGHPGAGALHRRRALPAARLRALRGRASFRCGARWTC